jgi:hypothetical protein
VSTDILRRNSLDTPEDADVVIGYLFLVSSAAATLTPYLVFGVYLTFSGPSFLLSLFLFPIFTQSFAL